MFPVSALLLSVFLISQVNSAGIYFSQEWTGRECDEEDRVDSGRGEIT